MGSHKIWLTGLPNGRFYKQWVQLGAIATDNLDIKTKKDLEESVK